MPRSWSAWFSTRALSAGSGLGAACCPPADDRADDCACGDALGLLAFDCAIWLHASKSACVGPGPAAGVGLGVTTNVVAKRMTSTPMTFMGPSAVVRAIHMP